MSDLFTVILEFEGTTSAAQFDAAKPDDALGLWLEHLTTPMHPCRWHHPAAFSCLENWMPRRSSFAGTTPSEHEAHHPFREGELDQKRHYGCAS